MVKRDDQDVVVASRDGMLLYAPAPTRPSLDPQGLHVYFVICKHVKLGWREFYNFNKIADPAYYDYDEGDYRPGAS